MAKSCRFSRFTFWSVLLALLSCLTAVPTTAWARLYETEQQLQSHYGVPIAKDEKSPDGGKFYTYRFREYEVRASIIGGKCLNEFYTRQDGKPLTTTQMQYWRGENSFGEHWGFLWRQWKLPCWVLGKWKALGFTFNRVPTTNSPGMEICTVGYARRVNRFSDKLLPPTIEPPPPDLL